MRFSKKLLGNALASLLCLTNASAVEWVPDNTWDPAQNAYVIPSGETHTMSSNKTLSEDMIVEGTFEVQSALYNDSTINIETGGAVNCIGVGNDFFNGSSSTGTINVNGGTLSTDSNFTSFENGSSAPGIINLNSGTITISQNNFENGYNASGTINIYNGTMSTSSTFISGYGTGQGTINITGGNLNITGGYLTNAGNSAGIINVSGGNLNSNFGGLRNGSQSGAGKGTINLTSGSINLNYPHLINGASGEGELNISGGSFNLDNTSEIKNCTGNVPGIINLSGGTLNLTNNSKIENGKDTTENVDGIINISGGTLNINNTCEFLNAEDWNGIINLTSGYLNINNGGKLINGNSSGIGTLNIDGGNLNLNSSGEFENGYGEPGIVNLNSGNFNNNGGDFFNGVNDPGTFNFNGGNFNSNSSGTFYNGYSDVGILNANVNMNFPLPGIFYNSYNTTAYLNVDENIKVNFVGEDFINGYGSPETGIININGDTYVYNTIKNGIGSNSGYINVNYSGNMFILGGKIENDTNGNIDVYAGGSLYNYHGTIDTDLGTFDIHASGKFENSRGNYPSTITVNGGGNLIDSHEIHLDKDLDIDYTWTVTDKVSIDGNGNEITFGPSGGILLEGADAQLSLDDVILNDVSGNKIRCTNTNARLLINNVIWNQDADYTFTLGQIFVSGDWLITGRGTNFNYESDATSTLSSNSIIHLLETTFNYNQAADDDLIEMIDGTSRFHLEFGTILASENWYLSNGTILTTGLGTLKGEALLDAQDLSKIKIAGSFRRVGNVLT